MAPVPDAQLLAADAVPPRGRVALLVGLAIYWGYCATLLGASAPFLARGFGLDDARMAWLFAVMALDAVPTFLLMRWADRYGRRRVLRVAVTALPVASLLAALAPDLASFAAAQIVRGALTGALNASLIVVVAEVLPTRLRARGQALNGIGGAIGAGAALVTASSLADVADGWRWAWGGAAAALPLVPLVRRLLPETERYARAAARGATAHVPWLAAFEPRLRRRTLGRLVSFFAGNIAGAASGTWIFYHGVRTLGIEPGWMTAALMVGGAVGIAGFPLGARAADRFGRRPTVLAATLLATASGVAFYALPLRAVPSHVALLGLVFSSASLASNAALTAGRTQAAELVPTHLRGAFFGWLSLAEASSYLLAQALAGTLALALGGLAPAIVALQVLLLPALAIYLVFVPETAGLELEVAALETAAPERD